MSTPTRGEAERLWSFWDMMRSVVGDFYYNTETLKLIRDRTTASPSDEVIEKIKICLVRLNENCEELQLTQTCKYIKGVLIKLRSKSWSDELLHYLNAVITLLENEAVDRYIYHIKKEKSELYFIEFLRWAEITKKFPSANVEVMSALNCYMYNENTACVFHLMRIVEHGLRALARERKVTIPKKPLEWANWQDILNKLKKSCDVVASWRAGPTKDAALEFYRGAHGEFESFKDTYRNNVMHVRKKYDEYDAASLLIHVRGFMERLSTRLNEHDSKAILWGRK